MKTTTDPQPGLAARMKRLLCVVGIHDWACVQFVYGGWFECDRCGARR